ncbi:MAG: hypothetical protein KF716_07255 [Anaerolineae bacterium]|nr:hypothetical protein [Anaerolineae bacterium]
MTILRVDFEHIERRILGAVQFTDLVTGLPVRERLELNGAKAIRNLSGLYVILAPASKPSKDVQKYLDTFKPTPSVPDVGSVKLPMSVEDPSGNYLARRFTLKFPLQATNAERPNYLFKPIEVALYPAPRAQAAQNWAVARVSVQEQGKDNGLGGAMILLRRQTTIIGRGLTDARGEAFVAAMGLPLIAVGSGTSILIQEYDVTLEARYDPTLKDLPDPDTLETAAGLKTNQVPAKIAPGRSDVVKIAIALP